MKRGLATVRGEKNAPLMKHLCYPFLGISTLRGIVFVLHVQQAVSEIILLLKEGFSQTTEHTLYAMKDLGILTLSFDLQYKYRYKQLNS